jgi:hypothetical protein
MEIPSQDFHSGVKIPKKGTHVKVRVTLGALGPGRKPRNKKGQDFL